MKIRLYNKIAPCGIALLPADFEVGEDVTGENGILVRSADLHETAFSENLAAIARAGAGVNNIPLDRCTEAGIAVFNTPGANAESVMELCLAGLFLSSRRIEEGIQWSETLAGDPEAAKRVEKEKSRFQGPEVFGKTLGVIGLGAVGGRFADAAAALGMTVIGYDPYLSDASRKQLDARVDVTGDIDRVFRESDYISVHVPSLPSTRGILGKENLSKCRPGVRILNLARADLAVEEDILAGLESGAIASYFTDFPTTGLAGKPGVIATPHLGASTPEAEDHCAEMACRELADYLLNGNVRNSVNFPNLALPRRGAFRVGVLCRKEAAEKVAGYLPGAARASRGELTYFLFDGDVGPDLAKLQTVEGVIHTTRY